MESFDARQDLGVILGDDGQRYPFRRINVLGAVHRVAAGTPVEFQVYGVTASDIQPVPEETRNQIGKSNIVAGLLAIFLGGFGAHKFYLGYTRAGAIMLVAYVLGFAMFAVPTMIVGLIALVEGIIYLSRPADQFHKTYVVGQKEWF